MRARLAIASCCAVLLVSCGGGTEPPTPPAAAPERDWSTFQGNAAHTGFVDLTVDVAKIAPAWTWARPAGDPEPIGGINSVATGAGRVFVTKDVYFGQGAVYALDESDGRVLWNYDTGPLSSMGPPAFADGTVFVPTTDPSSNCVIQAVSAASGSFRARMPSTCQWTSHFAPTPAGSSILHTAETGIVHSHAASDGALRWQADAGAFDQTTPAADAQRVYQYGTAGTGPGLRIIDGAGGATVATIADPFSASVTAYSMFSAPMISSPGRVIVFSGGGFSGRAAGSSEQYDSRILVSYDTLARRVAWRSADAYLTHPAVADGVVYAARNAPARLDALSELDGAILWSWTPPAGTTRFHRNAVVTRNLVFVSTDLQAHAIDLATRRLVWSAPHPGMLAISAASTLLIATGTSLSDGNLVAYRLR